MVCEISGVSGLSEAFQKISGGFREFPGVLLSLSGGELFGKRGVLGIFFMLFEQPLRMLQGHVQLCLEYIATFYGN